MLIANAKPRNNESLTNSFSLTEEQKDQQDRDKQALLEKIKQVGDKYEARLFLRNTYYYNLREAFQKLKEENIILKNKIEKLELSFKQNNDANKASIVEDIKLKKKQKQKFKTMIPSLKH